MTSGGPVQLDNRRLQHAQQGHNSVASTDYIDIAADLHVHPSPNVLMDASSFNDFSYSFDGVPDQAPLVHMPGQPGVDFPDPSTDAFSHMSAMTAVQGPPHSGADGVAIPMTTSAAGASIQRTSADDDSDDGAHETSSPGPHALDDAVDDEFDLSGRGRSEGITLGGKGRVEKGDAPPAWSELKTKAGKERKRLPLACIACRRKKIRCSGEKPACKHCLRSRIPCVYKVTTRKAAPRTDYMAMLDKRLKRMEERIIKVIPKAEQDAVSSITRAVVKPAIPGTFAATKSASKKRGADEAFGADLEAWAKAPSKTRSKDDEYPGSFPPAEVDEDQLLSEGIDVLPSKEVQEHLAEVFFDNVYGQAYHLLHKPSYMRKLKNNELPPVLVLSVCAVAARFTGNPQFNSTTRQFLRGEEWASQARDICTRRYEWPNITVLTCLLILGLHEFGTCQGGRSWALGGQAIRMAFALQLHKDLDHDPIARGPKKQLSFIDREIRRRIMWACFLMDRFNSSGAERPLFVREETINIPLPVKERYFQFDMPVTTQTLDGRILDPEAAKSSPVPDPREAMGVAAYMVRSISIWGRIISYLNQGGKENDEFPMWDENSQYSKLLNEAEHFHSTLPESLKFSTQNLELHDTENTASQYLLLHISIQQNILFMNRNVVSSAALGDLGAPQEFISLASAKTFAVANRISELLKAAEATRHFVSAPFAGYCAFSSTTIHILAIFSGNATVKATAEANMSVNIKYLRKMKQYWGMFHWMVENIRDQYRDALDAARAGTRNNNNANTSPILQYGDWFNKYPHGVNDADFMDPAKQKQKEKGADGVLEPKPELQSVEDFFATLSPSQNNEKGEGSRGGTTSKRKAAAKKQSAATNRTAQQQPEPLNTDSVARSVQGQLTSQAQQPRRFSGAMAGQTSGPATFTPLTVPHTQGTSYHAISPISPVNINQFGSQAQNPAFFPSDMLAMNMPPQSNGMVQPIDQQLGFGNYPMDSGTMANAQNMIEPISGWQGMDAQAAGRMQSRQGMKVPADAGNDNNAQVQIPREALANFNAHDGSAQWFMPFNMEPPDPSADMTLGGGNVDAFGGMFGGGGNEMSTTNPMGGLRHAP